MPRRSSWGGPPTERELVDLENRILGVLDIAGKQGLHIEKISELIGEPYCTFKVLVGLTVPRVSIDP